MKKALLLALKLAITTTLLVMIFREHKLLSVVVPHLAGMGQQWQWVLVGLACAGLSTWLGALRWQILLVGQDYAVRGSEVMRVTLASNFFNITSLGVAGGDAYRVVALMGPRGVQRLPVLVSVMLDHLMGLVGLGLLFFGCAVVFWNQWENYGPEVQTLVRTFSIFMAGSLVFLLLSAISFSPRVYAWGEQRWPRLLGYPPLKKFVQGCDALRRSWRSSVGAALLSIVIFVTHFFTFYCGIRAVGGEAVLMDVMAAMPIVDTAAGLPISVSGLGVREKTFETLLHAMSGLPEATAVSASLAGWLMSVVWGLIGGLVFLRGSSDKAVAAVHATSEG